MYIFETEHKWVHKLFLKDNSFRDWLLFSTAYFLILNQLNKYSNIAYLRLYVKGIIFKKISDSGLPLQIKLKDTIVCKQKGFHKLNNRFVHAAHLCDHYWVESEIFRIHNNPTNSSKLSLLAHITIIFARFQMYADFLIVVANWAFKLAFEEFDWTFLK